MNNKDLLHINIPSKNIRFIYDGNPRSYFGKENEIDHVTNSSGFRGKEFSLEKPKGTFRIAFLGDSFTFGEGVRFEDTFPEKISSMLSKRFRQAAVKFESYNFGVGGYNTVQELFLLKNIALQAGPDMVVVGFTLGDVEPPLLRLNALTGDVMRNPCRKQQPRGHR